MLSNLTLVTLEHCELERLFQLAIEGAELATGISGSFARDCYLLAAQCSLELVAGLEGGADAYNNRGIHAAPDVTN